MTDHIPSAHEEPFPVDDTTLELLAAACRINPDSGHMPFARWVTSDLYLELGDRVRWPLLQENGPQPAGMRAFHISNRAFLSEPRPKARPIVDVPVQLDLLGAA